MISGFRREVDEKCTILGYCPASNGNSLPTFRDNLSIPFPPLPFINPIGWHHATENLSTPTFFPM